MNKIRSKSGAIERRCRFTRRVVAREQLSAANATAGWGWPLHTRCLFAQRANG